MRKIKNFPISKVLKDMEYFEMRAKYMLEESARIAQEDIDKQTEDAKRFLMKVKPTEDLREDMDGEVKYFELRAKYMLEESARIAQEDIDRRAEDARFDESRTMKNESHDHQHNTSKHSAKYGKDLTGHMDDNNTD